ncbi:hypothetical protein [Rubellicoccus peritrichatus]|uniref:Uncharacterized protein n=1 Tax=Rubellicoccus peritrichatus TaxID=3080537 RepID=A0AAQ3LC84_9BACT|nr:hypothetical protein [Puniceicoccus sp. CR14]WOO42687.1 hypothetical protein RZN69_06250 [Puniceicoccus sp. CR14]
MPLYRTIHLLTLASLLTIPGISQAQSQPNISARFGTLFWSNQTEKSEQDFPQGLYFKDGNDYTKLDYQYTQIGKIQTYRGPNEMVIYTRSTDQNGAVQFTSVSQCTIPAGSSRFFLFLLPQKDKNSLRTVAVNISPNRPKNGSLLMINLTPYPMAARIRGTESTLKPGEITVFDPKKSENQALPVQISIFDEEWKPAYSTVARISETRPYLSVFYMENNQKGAYRLRIFRNLDMLNVTQSGES